MLPGVEPGVEATGRDGGVVGILPTPDGGVRIGAKRRSGKCSKSADHGRVVDVCSSAASADSQADVALLQHAQLAQDYVATMQAKNFMSVEEGQRYVREEEDRFRSARARMTVSSRSGAKSSADPAVGQEQAPQVIREATTRPLFGDALRRAEGSEGEGRTTPDGMVFHQP